MNLKVLKSFLAVCRIGNISKAAQVLYVSQPALTRQIQELEEELGCKLLNRNARGLSLTESGYVFQVRAQEILNLAEQAKKEISETSEYLRGIIRIGCVESAASAFLSSFIRRIRDKYPHVQYEIYSADGDDLRYALDENKLDLAFLLEPVEAAKYQKVDVPVKDRWGVVVRDDYLPPNETYVTAAEVGNMPLILPRRYIVVDEISAWFAKDSGGLNVVAYHNLPSNALMLVRSGVGSLVCVEGSFINRGMPGVKFLPVQPDIYSAHVLVRKKNRPLSRAAEIFWKEMEFYRREFE
jgi:DNA-binding transcriptional LysR family regulator